MLLHTSIKVSNLFQRHAIAKSASDNAYYPLTSAFIFRLIAQLVNIKRTRHTVSCITSINTDCMLLTWFVSPCNNNILILFFAFCVQISTTTSLFKFALTLFYLQIWKHISLQDYRSSSYTAYQVIWFSSCRLLYMASCIILEP